MAVLDDDGGRDAGGDRGPLSRRGIVPRGLARPWERGFGVVKHLKLRVTPGAW
jgi:hypothetical protein